jgi:multisubunit Na+/H+ antiporter MnhB subunit
VKLPWAVSTAQAAYELLGIKSWARTPHRIDYDHVMGNWAWSGPWAVRSLEDWNARLLLAGAVAGILCVLFGARVSRLVMAAAGGLAIGLTYWFFSAPDVRFGSGYLAATGMLGLAIACEAYFRHFLGTNFAHRLTLEAVAASMLIGAAGVVKYGNTWAIQNPPAFVTMAAPGGTQIWVPREVDQCWNQQLPCTPYFNPDALQRVRWR